ncbi:hypothetical protein WA158_007598 [Blastocystis sp. Blastoise]
MSDPNTPQSSNEPIPQLSPIAPSEQTEEIKQVETKESIPSVVTNESHDESENSKKNDVSPVNKKKEKSNKNDANFLGTAPLVKTILKLTYPDFFAKVASASFSFADALYISNLAGDTPEERSLSLGAVTIAFPIEQAFQMGLALLFGNGFASTLGRYLGAKNDIMARRTLGNLYFLDILCGILYPIIIIPLLPYILQLLGASEEAGTLEIGRQYIMIYSLGSILTNFMIGNNNLIRSEGRSMYSASIMIVGFLFNIIMDPVFISVFKLGVNGAAICTLVGDFLAVILGFSYYMTGRSVVKFEWKNISPNCEIIKDGLSVGVSGFIMTASSSVVSVVFNRLMLHFSPYPPESIQTTELISALGGLTKIYSFFFLPLLALSHGILPILAYCRGAKLQKRFMDTTKVCVYSALIVACILYILGLTCAYPFAYMFSDSPLFVETFSFGLRIMVLVFPINCLFFAVLPALQASKQGLFAGLLAFFKNCLFNIVFGVILCYALNDYNGLFYAYPLSDFTNLIITIIVYYTRRKYFVPQEKIYSNIPTVVTIQKE